MSFARNFFYRQSNRFEILSVVSRTPSKVMMLHVSGGGPGRGENHQGPVST